MNKMTLKQKKFADEYIATVCASRLKGKSIWGCEV